MSREVLEQFGRFRRRHLWVRGWDLFLEAAFVMTITAGALLLVDRLLFELEIRDPFFTTPGRMGVMIGGTLALAAILAVLILFLRPTPPAQIAWRLDRAARGEERFLSALELSAGGGGGPFAEAVCRDAVDVARRVKPSRALPRAPLGYRWGIVLALATGTLLYAYPPHLYDAPRADFGAMPQRGPAPLEVQFVDGSIGAIDAFRWEFGDGQKGSGERVTHVYEAPGRYVAVLLLEGPGGGSRKEIEIEVLDPSLPAANFDVAPRKGRAPLEVRFENLSKNALRFEWDFGDGASSTEEAPVHTYDRPGLYTVQLKAANDASTDVIRREGAVKVVHPDAPLADFRAIPRSGDAPLEVYFEDQSSGELREWGWDFGDVGAGADGGSTQRNPTHVYKTPGWYTVRLTVKGPHGEDVEEKVRFIHVRDKGKDGGGGRGDRTGGSPRPTKAKGSANDRPGRLLGDRADRKKVKTLPSQVRHHEPGQGLVEKVVKIFDEDPDGAGPAREVLLEKVLPRYRRAAEEAMERERIPPARRALVRSYYEEMDSNKKSETRNPK